MSWSVVTPTEGHDRATKTSPRVTSERRHDSPPSASSPHWQMVWAEPKADELPPSLQFEASSRAVSAKQSPSVYLALVRAPPTL